MNNYDAVCSAARAMTDSKRFGLRRSAVTISTVGVIPRILSMPDDLPGLSLALSLHAPTQQLRETIVPSAKAYKLDKLMQAIASYQQRTQQKACHKCMHRSCVSDPASVQQWAAWSMHICSIRGVALVKTVQCCTAWMPFAEVASCQHCEGCMAKLEFMNRANSSLNLLDSGM